MGGKSPFNFLIYTFLQSNKKEIEVTDDDPFHNLRLWFLNSKLRDVPRKSLKKSFKRETQYFLPKVGPSRDEFASFYIKFVKHKNSVEKKKVYYLCDDECKDNHDHFDNIRKELANV